MMNWDGILFGLGWLVIIAFNIKMFLDAKKNPHKYKGRVNANKRNILLRLHNRRNYDSPSVKPFSDPLSSSLGSRLPHNVFNTSYRS